MAKPAPVVAYFKPLEDKKHSWRMIECDANGKDIPRDKHTLGSPYVSSARFPARPELLKVTLEIMK